MFMGWVAHVPSCMWRSEDNFWESGLFFHPVGSRDQVQEAKLSHKCLNPTSHPTGPDTTDTFIEIIVNVSK